MLGFCFVEMGSQDEAMAAIHSLHDKDIGGPKKLVVNLASKRQPYGGGEDDVRDRKRTHRSRSRSLRRSPAPGNRSPRRSPSPKGSRSPRRSRSPPRSRAPEEPADVEFPCPLCGAIIMRTTFLQHYDWERKRMIEYAIKTQPATA